MKKILVLLILVSGCSKKDSPLQPSSYISFNNGTGNVKYKGQFAGNLTGVGYYNEYVSDTLYQYEVFGGAGEHDFITMVFLIKDTLALQASNYTTLLATITYTRGDSLYIAHLVNSTFHIDINNNNVLNGNFSGTLKTISDADSVIITNGKIVNLPYSP